MVSCVTVPQFPTSVAWQNKDVLLIRVHVDGSLDSSEYRAIAAREAERRLPESTESDVPVYEIRCEFTSRPTPTRGARRLATVRLFPRPDPPSPLPPTPTPTPTENEVEIEIEIERTVTIVY